MYQKRDQEIIAEKTDFFIHDYMESNPLAKEECQEFLEFWRENTFPPKVYDEPSCPIKKIRFIDSLENSALVNDSLWFREQFSTNFLTSESLKKNLDSHAQKTASDKIPIVKSREIITLSACQSPGEVQDYLVNNKVETPIIAMRLSEGGMRRWVVEHPEKADETLSVIFLFSGEK